MMFDLEKLENYDVLSGCDEVGRGPLAGPVVGCCVLIEREFLTQENLSYLFELGVTDSKKLTTKKRKKLLEVLNIDHFKVNEVNTHHINNSFSISFSVRELSNELIDDVNILQASLMAMGSAFLDCDLGKKSKLLIDGNKTLNLNKEMVDEEAVVKGDSRSVVIGLASIIAKEYRDDLMIEFSKKYPQYGLEKHAGYPTKAHKEAIVQFGITPIHRKSFKGVKEYC
ncbi:ribonuclease HII [Halobacteriovorax sp.]|uniref:ribonuclease HII n=1 Tax=Halobacteriovorax sp. TaxID=2020862 RepID=UPI003564CF36